MFWLHVEKPRALIACTCSWLQANMRTTEWRAGARLLLLMAAVLALGTPAAEAQGGPNGAKDGLLA